MKGNNTLTINQATLMQAVQMLVDAQMPGHEVKAVKLSNGYGSADATVELSEVANPSPTAGAEERNRKALDHIDEQLAIADGPDAFGGSALRAIRAILEPKQ